MASKKSKIFSSIIVLAAGIAMISLHQRIELLSWISIIVGLTFILPSAFLLINIIGSKGPAPAGSTIASIGGLVLGLLMCIFPETFAGMFVYVFAILLVIGGFYHIIVMAKRLPGNRPLFMYIIPALLIATGIVILCTDLRKINSMVVLVTGIAFVAYSINSMIECFSSGRKSAASNTSIDHTIDLS